MRANERTHAEHRPFVYQYTTLWRHKRLIVRDMHDTIFFRIGSPRFASGSTRRKEETADPPDARRRPLRRSHPRSAASDLLPRLLRTASISAARRTISWRSRRVIGPRSSKRPTWRSGSASSPTAWSWSSSRPASPTRSSFIFGTWKFVCSYVGTVGMARCAAGTAFVAGGPRLPSAGRGPAPRLVRGDIRVLWCGRPGCPATCRGRRDRRGACTTTERGPYSQRLLSVSQRRAPTGQSGRLAPGRLARRAAALAVSPARSRVPPRLGRRGTRLP